MTYQDANQVLEDCVITDNILRLPEAQLDRKLYLKVADALNLIGGQWKSGKIKGFVFPIGSNPEELIDVELIAQRIKFKQERGKELRTVNPTQI